MDDPVDDLALVTGGSGYFGSLLVAELRARGRRVRVLDLHDADDRPADVDFVAGDIRSAVDVRRALDGVGAVFHNVAQVPLARDKELFDSVNVGGTETLLRACEDAGVRKVVHTSSSAVFGVPAANPVTRETVPRPAEAYGRAKYEGELLCQAAVSRGLDVTIVRPRTILGLGRLGIFGILFDWIADGAAVPVLGDGSNRYQFVHARDLADACIRAGARPGPATYNIGAEQFGTMRETVANLCEYAGTGARVVSLPVGATAAAMQASARLGLTPFGAYHWIMYSRSMWFDLAPAQQELGWRPAHTTDESFRESYDWFLAHRAELSTSGGSAHRSLVRQGVLGVAKRLLR
ncbi:MAG: NAD-dependent epimerase/dehydratase family protein [Nocardioides sp.]|nr:NAD-dependent epimerase/dehydratase family protein [Nocardioides sp.]